MYHQSIQERGIRERIMKKKVYVSLVETNNPEAFAKALRKPNHVLSFVTGINYEITDLHETEEESFDRGVIKGIFVTTRSTEIPPQHEPGSFDDYSAVVVDEGKGLAYPNVFIFDKKDKDFLIEVNTNGIRENRIEDYIRRCVISDNPDFWIKLTPAIRGDFDEVVKRLSKITSIEATVYDPIGAIASDDSSLSDIRKIAESTSGRKIDLKVSIGRSKSSLNLESIKKLISSFRNLEKAKFLVKGVEENGDAIVKRVLNLVNYRYSYEFDLKGTPDSINSKERLTEISKIYQRYLNDTGRSNTHDMI